MLRVLSTRVAAATAVVAVALVVAAPAGAHVTVNPSTAAQGGFATVSFQVPNERDDASTVKVEVELPTDQPIAFVSTQPVPGWNVEVAKTKLATPVKTDDGDVTEAVSKITWSGGQIAPGQFQAFPVSMGPLPKTDALMFKAVQTYSNGDVVRWIETAPEGAAEPKNPAPELKLVAEAASDAHGGSSSGKAMATSTHSDDSTARTLAIVGIVLGGLALVLGLAAFARKGSGAKA
ncbi:MAG: YcnI family protein [Acidimicrobiia bacterium]